MAYLGKHNWWLQGPVNPRGFGGLGQTCSDGTTYQINFGCSDGNPPTCPPGYSLSTGSGQYSCTNNSGASLLGIPAATYKPCPAGQTCSIFGGVPDLYVYLGGGLIGFALLMSIVRGGR